MSRRKGKNTRNRSKKALERKRHRSKIFKSSKWKLNYSKYFKQVNYYPYIVRKDKNDT